MPNCSFKSKIRFKFFFKQKTAYEILSGLVGSEMCIRDRYKGANLPKHHVIDLYQNQLATKSSISLKTLEKVKGHLNKKDQVLFFINRRGFAPVSYTHLTLPTTPYV